MIYVVDTIIFGPDSVAIEDMITSLGIASEEQRHVFEIRGEGEVGDFLGICIVKAGPKKFTLTQTSLIAKALKEANMESCNTAKTPCSTVPLGKDEDGDPFNESWEYSTLVVMIMYLEINSRPDIVYAVNQCARFTYCPKASHALVITSILRYLRGCTRDGNRY